MDKSQILSLETERACLASLIHYNEIVPDVSAFVKPDYFYASVNGTIFSLIVATYQEKGSVDRIMLVTRLRQIGISDIDGLDVYRYIDVIYNTPTLIEHSLDYFRELVKFHFLRKTYKSLISAQLYIKNNLKKPLSEVIAGVSGLVTEAATGNIDEDDKIVDIYGELANELSNRAESGNEPALYTDFPIFDKWYGGLYMGDMYVFAAPAKRGKSTFLNCLAYNVVKNKKNNCKVLFLDTELESWRVMCRSASAITGINEWYFKNGKFKYDSEMVGKVHTMFNEIDPLKNKIYHKYIGNKPIDEIISICRRWYSKNIKDNENLLIIYDYIKLDSSGTGLSDHWKEYQAIGEKTDRLKKFASDMPRTAIATSIQTNANCDIAMSNQLKWFASNVYILKPKEPEEIQNEGIEFGTHRLVEVVTRNQGEEAKGLKNLIKVKTADGKEKYIPNYINLDMENFKFVEKGTYADIVTYNAEKLKAKAGGNEDDIDF